MAEDTSAEGMDRALTPHPSPRGRVLSTLPSGVRGGKKIENQEHIDAGITSTPGNRVYNRRNDP
jgi:hypothetical protein